MDQGSPDRELLLGSLQEASVVGHDLVLGQVQVELQRHQHGELEGDQLTAVHPKPLLQFLNQRETHIACSFILDQTPKRT